MWLPKHELLDESQLDLSKILIHSDGKTEETRPIKWRLLTRLVADSETDIRNGKLSVNSPIGKGLLGLSVGDIAEITGAEWR